MSNTIRISLNNLYKNLLDRDIDEPGFSFYSKKMLNNNWTLDNVQQDIISSDEYRKKTITSMYYSILKRTPDSFGFDLYLNSNKTLDEIRICLENSGESRTLILQSLYKLILYRDADKEGLNDYLNMLNNGTPISNIYSFLENSNEKKIIIIKSLYNTLLKREVDDNGLNYYLNKLNDGLSIYDIRYDIINSSEYTTIYPSDIHRYQFMINLLYNELLHRDADEYGINNYMNNLNSGASINDIRNNIIDSLEYKSYQSFYDNLPQKPSNIQHYLSNEFLYWLNKQFINKFNRQVDNVNKYYYNHLFLTNRLIIDSELESYISRVNQGKDIIKSKTFILCGCLRDKARIINNFKTRAYQIVKCFSDYRILIVENDSKDNTRDELIKWSKEDSKVLILGNGVNKPICKLNLPPTPPEKTANASRIRKMSIIRNIYLDYIKKHLSSFDYTAVIDMDLDGDLPLDGIFDTFWYLNNTYINAMACNGIEKYKYHYYDSFAYIEYGDPFIWKNEHDKTNHDHYVFDKITKKYTQSLNITKVCSAFGGFCIYKTLCLLNVSYNYSIDKFACEHSFVNSNIKDVYINPRMVYMITENS